MGALQLGVFAPSAFCLGPIVLSIAVLAVSAGKAVVAWFSCLPHQALIDNKRAVFCDMLSLFLSHVLTSLAMQCR